MKRAIDGAGGYKKYDRLQSISYTKRSVLYDEHGNVESDGTQFHRYILKPELSMNISWEKNGQKHEIIFRQNKATLWIANKQVEADGAALAKTCLSAHYVLFMPFKLLDPGVALSYKGVTILANGKSVHIIGASYVGGGNEDHGTQENWEYYFDKNSGDFMANMVDHGDYSALILNEQFTESGGIKFPAFRPSYRANAQREQLWKRGAFYYTDYITE